MSIIQNFIPFLIPSIAIAITQTLIYLNLKKTYQFKIVLFGNLILLGVGVLFSVIGLIVAQGEPGSWAGLGFIILLMVTVITTLISSGASLLMYVILKPTSKK
jgi:hypothetical protein